MFCNQKKTRNFIQDILRIYGGGSVNTKVARHFLPKAGGLLKLSTMKLG